jgi:hypothetical protein
METFPSYYQPQPYSTFSAFLSDSIVAILQDTAGMVSGQHAFLMHMAIPSPSIPSLESFVVDKTERKKPGSCCQITFWFFSSGPFGSNGFVPTLTSTIKCRRICSL